jgi:hypothetical protein
MKKLIFLSAIISLIALQSWSQNVNNMQLSHMKKPSVRKEIQLPDIPGYKTLKCDFHMHTIFSDGIVWPATRVREAWEEGLDAISITDHIEHRPHREYVKGNHNSPYEIALPVAEQKDIILIRGGEITRDMPPGHLNGLFLEDVNALDTPDPEDAVRAAINQGGFVLWNHPGWKAQQPDTCVWMDMHQDWYEKGYIHGIEVFNEKEWYPIVIDWCLNKELAMIGNSDIHDVNAHYYDVENGHRPMTLVFATERTQQAIKEAMFDRRTIAWFDDKMAGPEKLLKAFFEASVEFGNSGREDKNQKVIRIKNVADMPFYLSHESGQQFTIPALAEVYLTLPDDVKSVWVMNMFTGTNKTLSINLSDL